MRWLVVFFVLPALGFLSGCCDDLDHMLVYELDVSVRDSVTAYTYLTDSAATTADTLFLDMETRYFYMADAAPGFEIIGTARAHSCLYGMEGSAKRILGFRFTSDQPFAGVPAGESLNAFVKGNQTRLNSETETYTVSTEDLGASALHFNRYPQGSKFVVLQKPTEAVYRRIRITLIHDDGTLLTGETPLFLWE